jgi:hypothetical protein
MNPAKKMPTPLATPGSPSSSFDAQRAFSRNIGVVSQSEQALLATKRVAIPGCGGVGGVHALTLARAGVGRFCIADFDTFEIENFNRQIGASMRTLGKNKADVIREQILDINPHADVRMFTDAISIKNIDAFLDGVDLIVDSLDFFAFASRDMLFPEASRRSIPILSAAPLGMSSAFLVFSSKGMPFQRYFGFRSGDSIEERATKFAIGLAPKALHRSYLDAKQVNFQERRGPSHIVGVTLCAAVACAEGINILTGKPKIKPAPHYQQFDARTCQLIKGKLWGGFYNPIQQLKYHFFKQVFFRRVR